MINRFEFLEDMLQRLDKVAFSHSEAQPPAIRTEPETSKAEDDAVTYDRGERFCEKVKGNGKHDPAEPALTSPENLKTTAVTQAPLARSAQKLEPGGEHSVSYPDGIGDSDEKSLTASAEVNSLQEEAIQECRRRLAVLVDEVTEEAGRRLRHLADQTSVSFLGDAETSLQKSANSIANKALQLLQHEIQTAMRQCSSAPETGMKPIATGKDVGQAGSVKPGNGFISRETVRRENEDVERELVTAVEAIRIRSNTSSGSSEARAQAPLQPFEEKALKQIAASLQETLGNLAERKIEPLRESPKRLGLQEPTYSDTRRQPEATIEEPPVPTSSGSGTEDSAPAPSDRGRIRHTTQYLASVIARAYMDSKERERAREASGPSDEQSASQPKKSTGKQLNWRILGLG
jgi:hypothetical protein